MFNQMVKYTPDVLNRTFAALADPTRRRILAHLAHGDRCVTDLARPHRMSLPAVSKHLRVLENAGLIRRKRYGRVHELKLEALPMKKAAQWMEDIGDFGKGPPDVWGPDWKTPTNQATRRGGAYVSGPVGVETRRWTRFAVLRCAD